MDFSGFNLNSRLNIVKKDGKLVATKLADLKILSYYKLYSFYVEVVYDESIGEITRINTNQRLDNT
jgi:hypothetical protein